MTTLRRIGFVVGLLVLWSVASRIGIWDPSIFPAPERVGATLWRLAKSGALVDATSVSLRRVVAGYLVSLSLGVPLGILLARSRWAADTIGLAATGVQALPSICWLPLALLWFGLSDKAILFVVVAGSLASIAITVQDGVKNLPPTYVRAARTLGASPQSLTWRVLFPATLPAILTGAKLGWAYAWRGLMAGELLYVSIGLGHLLQVGRELADTSQVLSVMVVIMVIGLATDILVFGYLEQLVREIGRAHV